MRTTLLVLVSVFAFAATSHAYDWKEVRHTMGIKGEEDKGVLLIKYTRDDLDVTMHGSKASPDLVFDTWYGFWPMSDGSVMLMGDTVVTEPELPAVLNEIAKQGLELTAVHNHLAGENPRIFFIHLSGKGSAAELARKAKAILSRTNAPQKEHKESKKASVDWSPITKILGKSAETEGDIAEYSFLRREKLTMQSESMPSTEALETAPEVKFQMLSDGQAVSYGEMILTAKEIAPVSKIITQSGMLITALHNHMTEEEPRLFFMHWWGVGDAAKLATAVRQATEAMNVEKASD
ncbi:MAG: DUF1259 domain-containing protein [Nibricoccus sp.]